MTWISQKHNFHGYLLQLGLSFNVIPNVDMHVISTYRNNNEQLTSNAIKNLSKPLQNTSKNRSTGGLTSFIWCSMLRKADVVNPVLRQTTHLHAFMLANLR